ncbi:5-formyltetrahydrofolate cyclo-ligase [Lentibacillus salinarum]|uniref:5-formyltetrahydrofolate cyclo-ligase n=1 Tax=Lentibacillus salinarum TaxID=446820 RepID=A0ABW3ZXY9_9BACI
MQSEWGDELEKKELRKHIIQRLQTIPDADRASIEEALTGHLVSSAVWQQADVIGITVSHGLEWNTEPIIQTAWKEGKTVCVPKCHPENRQMDFYIIHDYDQLETVYYKLREPIPEKTEKVAKQAIDLLVVPGLLFDREGYRVGFGGGYYDRFLTDFVHDKLALAANCQVVEKLPAEPFDIPVDAIITENGFLQQGGV